jgi:hypothetical protein
LEEETRGKEESDTSSESAHHQYAKKKQKTQRVNVIVKEEGKINSKKSAASLKKEDTAAAVEQSKTNKKRVSTRSERAHNRKKVDKDEEEEEEDEDKMQTFIAANDDINMDFEVNLRSQYQELPDRNSYTKDSRYVSRPSNRSVRGGVDRMEVDSQAIIMLPQQQKRNQRLITDPYHFSADSHEVNASNRYTNDMEPSYVQRIDPRRDNAQNIERAKSATR